MPAPPATPRDHPTEETAISRAALARPRTRTSPFADVRPGLVASVAYLVAIGVWLVAGDSLPGGRWLAVHLFTLGVLTNAVSSLTLHFGHTLTRTPGDAGGWRAALVLNAAVLTTLAGTSTGTRWATGVGATALVVVVFLRYRTLRRARETSLGARFTWCVRLYERAHGSFIHGATLGALLGLGVFGGAWYGGARLAHLHVNVLGWGGLTLLATIVFFGPTMLRRPIAPGSDARAARALKAGATGLTAAALLLLLTGEGGTWGEAARWAAATGLAVYAWSATVVCLPVATVAREASPGASRGLVLGVCVWFPAAAWADVAVVATGSWRYLDAVGVALLVGVLAQAIVGSLLYLLPMLHRDAERGARLRQLLGTAPATRAVVLNVATAAIVAGVALRPDGPLGALAPAGWLVLLVVLASVLGITVWTWVGAPAQDGVPADA